MNENARHGENFQVGTAAVAIHPNVMRSDPSNGMVVLGVRLSVFSLDLGLKLMSPVAASNTHQLSPSPCGI